MFEATVLRGAPIFLWAPPPETALGYTEEALNINFGSLAEGGKAQLLWITEILRALSLTKIYSPE